MKLNTGVSPESEPGLEGDSPYRPIELDSLRSHSVLAFDVYIRIGNRFALYLRRQRETFDPAMKQRLLESGASTVYILKHDQPQYEEYVVRHLGEILSDPQVAPRQKARVFHHTTTNLVKRALNEPLSEAVFGQVGLVVGALVEHIEANRDIFPHLFSMVSHDNYTFVHSVNVCCYSVALGRYLDSFAPRFLEELGTGALLHDLGKTRIDPRVLNKPGRLNAEEWEQVKRHPEWGWQMLKQVSEMPEPVRQAVLEHQERSDGSGYPLGLAERDISPAGRIVAVADVYDALTSRRSYREAMTPFTALEVMKREMGGKLAPEIYRELVFMLGGGRKRKRR